MNKATSELRDPDRQPQGSWPYVIFVETGVVLVDRGPKRPRWRVETRGAVVKHSGTTCDACTMVIREDEPFALKFAEWPLPSLDELKPADWATLFDPMRHLPRVMHKDCVARDGGHLRDRP